MNQNIKWEDIMIPEELEQVIVKAVDMGRKEVKANRRSKMMNVVISVAGMAAALTLIVGMGYVNPMIVKAYSRIPFVGNIFSYLYHLEDTQVPYSGISNIAEPVKAITKDDTGDAAIADREEKEDYQDGLNISLKEAYCDGYSLYLSIQLKGEEPFYKDSDTKLLEAGNMEGYLQMLSKESVVLEDGSIHEINDDMLNFKGVFVDANTFVGIARSKASFESYNPDSQMEYSVITRSIKGYSELGDIRLSGNWRYGGIINSSPEKLVTERVNKQVSDEFLFSEVRIQPYELQAVIEETQGKSMGMQAVCMEAFDDAGNRLRPADNVSSRVIKDGDVPLEIWMFERTDEANKVTFYVLDEIKWLDEWKGNLYSENPWTGLQMMEFLKENCLAYEEVELK